jgi:transposase InsO family protein
VAGRVVPVAAALPLGRGLSGHSGHHPGLAPQAGVTQVGLHRTPSTGTSPDHGGNHETCDAYGKREPHLGHRRVQGELVRLGHRIAAATVWQILHDAGINPAPRRSGSSWRQFLITQAKAVLAVDFVHVDTVLLRRIYALIAVEHGSRRTHLVGVSAHPTGEWTTQAARNLLMDLGDRVTSIKFLLRDRDSRFARAFDADFAADNIRILTSPPRVPRANAICERMIGTLRRELFDRILIVDERRLRRIISIYLHHFNTARPHRTLGQLAPAQAETHPPRVINLATTKFAADRSSTGSPASTSLRHDQTKHPNLQVRHAILYSSPTGSLCR